ncbi:hypothetical protein GmHk_20G057806 [Glycine max]|nr:hypothetical protein GmHk_20G057806 [Glycine max]
MDSSSIVISDEEVNREIEYLLQNSPLIRVILTKFISLNFSLISFKKISDCLVFYQLINQDSRLFLNVKEIHWDKKTIDLKYRRGMNVFFFFSIFHFYLMNLTSSHSSTL